MISQWIQPNGINYYGFYSFHVVVAVVFSFANNSMRFFFSFQTVLFVSVRILFIHTENRMFKVLPSIVQQQHNKQSDK